MSIEKVFNQQTPRGNKIRRQLLLRFMLIEIPISYALMMGPPIAGLLYLPKIAFWFSLGAYSMLVLFFICSGRFGRLTKSYQLIQFFRFTKGFTERKELVHYMRILNGKTIRLPRAFAVPLVLLAVCDVSKNVHIQEKSKDAA